MQVKDWRWHQQAPLAILLPGRAVRILIVLATSLNLALAFMLPDIFENAGLTLAWGAILAAGAAVLLLASPRVSITRMDVGVAILCLGATWPRLAGGSLSVPGAAGVIAITYATGRLGGLRPRTLALAVLSLAAAQGAVAIAQSLPGLESLVPFTPMRHGLPNQTIRATGLFNNPNTLGVLEAAAVLPAASLARCRLALILAAVCLTGLVLSSSREAVLGLLAGLAVLSAQGLRRHGWASTVSSGAALRAAQIGAVAMAVAAATMLLSPATLRRFDPSGASADHNLLDRIESWKAALSFIGESPIIGHGAVLPVRVVDNVYLEWLLAGGLVGLALWMGGLLILQNRATLPLIILMLTVGLFANAFSGPLLSVLLLVCGSLAAAASEMDRHADSETPSATLTLGARPRPPDSCR